jgi:redox-sensitive bicupin YhaK (pirin superfamily)
MSVRIRRATDRFIDRAEGRVTHHAFAFGTSYDPAWLSFGPMVCHDDHLLGSGRGFEEHPHSGLEIVTWVAQGALRHTDTSGKQVVLNAGECAVLTAGPGIRHTEFATEDGPARFVQTWLTPDSEAVEPSYANAHVEAAPGDGLVPLVGDDAPLRIDVAGASLDVVRMAAGESITLPTATRRHVYVASGALLRSGMAEPLQTGDAYFFEDEPERSITAGIPTELLIWTFRA